MFRPAAQSLAVLLVVSLAPIQAVAASWTTEKERAAKGRIQGFVQPEPVGHGVPAMSVAVTINGEVVYSSGLGDARPGVPAGPHTRYRIGSITKQFTAAAMLRLIETGATVPTEGRPLALDTPLDRVLEGANNWAVEGQRRITIRHLLNMNSNLPNFTRRPPENSNPWGSVRASELLGALKSLKPSGWPNSFEYSNTNYFLLAEVVQAVASAHRGRRVDYAHLLHDLVLDRAGLRETETFTAVGSDAGLAEPHYRRKPAFADADWLKGSGDLVSTVADLARWNGALVSGRVISRTSLDAMFGDGARVAPREYYGMGWFIERVEDWDRYTHSGSVPGYTSFNALAHQSSSGNWLGVTLLTNSDGVVGLDDLAADLLYLASTD